MKFYTKLLGFRVSCAWPAEAPTFLLLDRDDVRLAFDVVEARARPMSADSVGFYLEVDDAFALHRKIRRRVKIEWGPEVYSYGRREFAIRDPEGYLIIFTEKTDDPTTCTVD